MKDILRYLNGSSDNGIEYQKGGEESIKVFADADWASACLCLVAGAPVTYHSRRQHIVALSTTEAEYIAACEAVREIKWLQTLYRELDRSIGETTLYIDNQSAIRMIQQVETLRRSKHIDIKYHFIREAYENKQFKLEYVETEKQLADYLTKLLPSPTLERLKKASGIA